MSEMVDPGRAYSAISDEIDHLDHDELIDIAHVAIAIVVTRTKQGLDIDRKPFVAYKPAYAAERAKAGYSTKPDLARSGHMLGAMQPEVTGENQVTVSFASDLEAIKAAVNNDGSKKVIEVTGHKRAAYYDTKRGGRVSRKEWNKDQRRKNKRVGARMENVGPHQRKMDTPAREFLGVRQSREMDMIADVASEAMARRVEGKIK